MLWLWFLVLLCVTVLLRFDEKVVFTPTINIRPGLQDHFGATYMERHRHWLLKPWEAVYSSWGKQANILGMNYSRKVVSLRHIYRRGRRHVNSISSGLQRRAAEPSEIYPGGRRAVTISDGLLRYVADCYTITPNTNSKQTPDEQPELHGGPPAMPIAKQHHK